MAGSADQRKSSRGSLCPDIESSHGGNGGDPSEGHHNGNESSAAASSRSGLIQPLFQLVEEIIGAAHGLIEVYADRARLSVQRVVVQAVIGAGAAVCAAIWLGAAALATLRGACGGLTALWGGREWLGDLTGGLLALVLAASAVALVLRLSSRRELARLKAKYERIQDDHGKNHDTASPTGDGKGVPGARGSAGDPEDLGHGAAPGYRTV